MSKDHLAKPMAGFSLSASYAEFKQKAHLVPVVPTRDPSGRVVWNCRDNLIQPDAFGALRQFVFHCQRYLESVTGEKMDDAAGKQWVDQSVSRFLDPDHPRWPPQTAPLLAGQTAPGRTVGWELYGRDGDA